MIKQFKMLRILTVSNQRFVLFLLYFPESKKREIHAPALYLDLPHKMQPPISAEWKVSLIVAATCIGHLAISFFISVILLAFVGGPDHWQTNYWAAFLGILSMILASLQYLPQIWKTWKAKVKIYDLCIYKIINQTLNVH
jgi:hypothetical protein